ncbi:hypothetical protein [Nocardia sp. IFM 10818]
MTVRVTLSLPDEISDHLKTLPQGKQSDYVARAVRQQMVAEEMAMIIQQPIDEERLAEAEMLAWQSDE